MERIDRRLAIGVLGLGLAATVSLTGCSSDSGHSSGDASTQQSVSQIPTIPGAGDAADPQLTVNGKPLPGIDLAQISCMRGSGIVNAGGGASPTDVNISFSDTKPPVLQDFAFYLNGVEYSGSDAKAELNGDRFSATGTARSIKPAQPSLTATFDIAITCPVTG